MSNEFKKFISYFFYTYDTFLVGGRNDGVIAFREMNSTHTAISGK